MGLLEFSTLLSAAKVKHAALRTPGPWLAARRAGRTCTVLRGRRRHDGRSAKCQQDVARFRLYLHQSLQANTRFAAFFKIY